MIGLEHGTHSFPTHFFCRSKLFCYVSWLEVSVFFFKYAPEARIICIFPTHAKYYSEIVSQPNACTIKSNITYT